MKDAFLEEAEGHTIVIIFWEKCPKQSGGCHLVIGWRADDRSSAEVWRADERSSAVESSVECLVWFSRNRVQSIPKTTFQQGKNLGVNHWWHVGMGAKGISLPATWLGLVLVWLCTDPCPCPPQNSFYCFPSFALHEKLEYDWVVGLHQLSPGPTYWQISLVVYAQNSLFICKNGNAFLDHHSLHTSTLEFIELIPS